MLNYSRFFLPRQTKLHETDGRAKSEVHYSPAGSDRCPAAAFEEDAAAALLLLLHLASAARRLPPTRILGTGAKLLKRACVRSKVLLIFSYFSSSQALAEAQC